MDKGRGGEGRSPSRNTRRLCRERLRIHLETARLIDELGWVWPAGSSEDTVRSSRQKVVAACDFSICLLETMGKLLEELSLQRHQALLFGENGLSKNQFGFRRGRPTVDAIQAVFNIATNARKGTGKRIGFCALTSIDTRNAFNTAS